MSEYLGSQNTTDRTSDFNAHSFLIKQLISKVHTCALVKILGVVSGTGINPVGFVTVQPLVNQIDGYGNPVETAILNNVPFFRLQGGTNAVILDPQVGDIGMALFTMRDSSTAKNTRGTASPGSRRRYSLSDGFYIGGWINGTPTQYVQFTPTGIAVTATNTVTINAPTTTVYGNLLVTGDVTAGSQGNDSVSLQNHIHGGVDFGGSSTLAPTAGT